MSGRKRLQTPREHSSPMLRKIIYLYTQKRQKRKIVNSQCIQILKEKKLQMIQVEEDILRTFLCTSIFYLNINSIKKSEYETEENYSTHQEI